MYYGLTNQDRPDRICPLRFLVLRVFPRLVFPCNVLPRFNPFKSWLIICSKYPKRKHRDTTNKTIIQYLVIAILQGQLVSYAVAPNSISRRMYVGICRKYPWICKSRIRYNATRMFYTVYQWWFLPYAWCVSWYSCVYPFHGCMHFVVLFKYIYGLVYLVLAILG